MDYPRSVPSVGLVNGKFVDEDVVSGTQGSLIPSAWGNAVTDEILNVIQAGDQEPAEGQNDQLLASIQKLVAAAKPDAASEQNVGVAKIATQTETNSGQDDSKFVTPKKLSVALSALVIQATEIIRGVLKIATQQQVAAGVDDSTAVTPKKLAATFPFRGRALITAVGVTNWPVPAGVTKVWVRVVAGGGGAGRYEGGGGGGGGGGVAEKIIDLTGVAIVPATVGAGGLGRTGSSGDGTNGGTSSFGTYCSATGGGGGSKWYGGQGGVGVGGDISTNLGNGAHQTRQDNSATSTSIYGGGHGGGPGGMGSGSGAKGSSGNDATLPGGGGGGGNENGNGGNGAPGSIEIRW